MTSFGDRAERERSRRTFKGVETTCEIDGVEFFGMFELFEQTARVDHEHAEDFAVAGDLRNFGDELALFFGFAQGLHFSCAVGSDKHDAVQVTISAVHGLILESDLEAGAVRAFVWRERHHVLEIEQLVEHGFAPFFEVVAIIAVHVQDFFDLFAGRLHLEETKTNLRVDRQTNSVAAEDQDPLPETVQNRFLIIGWR